MVPAIGTSMGSFIFYWVRLLHFASLPNNSNVVRDRGVGAECMSTFEDSDSYGSIPMCSLYGRAQLSVGLSQKTVTRMHLPRSPEYQFLISDRRSKS